MSFWKLLGTNSAASSLSTASDALKSGADWRTVGMAAADGGGSINGTALTSTAAGTSAAFKKTASKTYRRLY